MAKLFLDLSKMKAAGTKGEHVVFEHKDGHQVHVRHSALSPGMKSQLENLVKTKMAKGGKIPLSPSKPSAKEHKDMGTKPSSGGLYDKVMSKVGLGPTHDPDEALKAVSGALNAGKLSGLEAQGATNALNRRKGQYADGGEIRQSNPKLEESKKLPEYAEGTPEAPVSEADSIPINLDPNQTINPVLPQAPEQAPPSESFGDSPVNFLSKDVSTSQDIPAPQAPEQTAQASLPPPAIKPKGQEEQPPAQASPTSAIDSSYQKMENAERAIGQARANTAADTAKAIEQQQIDRQNADAPLLQKTQELTNHSDEIMKAIAEQKIDPNKYISDMSTVGKVSTGIGLLLGGIGGGLTGQENPAMKFLQAQIDRNIKGQEMELGKKENLLSAYSRQFNNLQQARDFTRLTYNDILKAQIEKAAAQNGSPLAQAEAAKQIAGIEQQRQMTHLKWGAMNTLEGGNTSEAQHQSALRALDLTDPENAKRFRDRYIPGMGTTRTPVSPETRNKLEAQQKLDVAAKDLYDWASKHSGLLPVTPENIANINVGRQKAQALQSLYREGTLGTVYREGEQPLLDKVVNSDPTSFFNTVSTLPKIKEIIGNNDRNLGVIKNQIGFEPFAGTPQPKAPQSRFIPSTFRRSK